MLALLQTRRAARLGLAAVIVAFEVATALTPAAQVYAQSSVQPQMTCLDSGPPDYPVPGGWFYTQAALGCVTARGPDRRRGYLVVDDDKANFWTEFRRQGGVDVLGYPVTQPYHYPVGAIDGDWYQAFQRGILQSPGTTPPGRAHLSAAFDMFDRAGFEPFLEFMGIAKAGPNMANLSFADDAERRMNWLVEPRFLARYFFDPVGFHSSDPERAGFAAHLTQEEAWEFFGLPQSMPQRMLLRDSVGGPELPPLRHTFISQRFQNGGLQLFLEDLGARGEGFDFAARPQTPILFDPTIVPGDGRNGCVVLTAVGLLARRIGTGSMIPREAVQPLPLVADAPPSLLIHVPPLVTPEQLDNTFQVDGMDYASGQLVTIVITDVRTATNDAVVYSRSYTVTAASDGSFEKVITAPVASYTLTARGAGSSESDLASLRINLAVPTTDLVAMLDTKCANGGLPVLLP